MACDRQEAAREVALMLRCEYDGRNMITLPPIHDILALRTAIALTGSDFCFNGDHDPLGLPVVHDYFTHRSSTQPSERRNHKAELWCDAVPSCIQSRNIAENKYGVVACSTLQSLTVQGTGRTSLPKTVLFGKVWGDNVPAERLQVASAST